MNMIRTDKMWTYSNTGVKIHGFVKDGQHVDAVALCSSRITRPSLDTAQDMEEIVKYGRRGSLCTRCVNRFDEYAVAPVAEQPEPFETKESSMKIEITSEVITALHNLRAGVHVAEAVNTLDNAGVFRSIDEATGYDVSAQPERVSKCTCPRSRATTQVPLGEDMHTDSCPGDPAEWGDMAFTDGPVQIGDNNVQSNTFPVISTQSALTGKIYRS